MRIVILGTGYVGLVSGACLAELGHEIICVDNNIDKIQKLETGIIPIYEPGLEKLVKKNYSAGKLKFTSNLSLALEGAGAVFLAVGTPTKKDCTSVDMSYIYGAAEDIKANLTMPLAIVVKSTVPVTTNKELRKIFAGTNCEIISNPEFLREGFAVDDFMHPERIVIGTNSQDAKSIMLNIYQNFDKDNVPMLFCSPESAELIKYASNAFLATKIAFINEMADLCEKLGANVEDLAAGMGHDSRIGSKFLKVGPGFGGSCFPKDTLALSYLASNSGLPSNIIDAVIASNDNRKKRLAARVMAILGGDLTNVTIACLGLSFKANTDDIRESPAIAIIKELMANGANIKAYDPASMENAKKELTGNINWCLSALNATIDAKAILILTEWDEFKEINFDQTDAVALFDYRNILTNYRYNRIKYYHIG
jgi:UDPglucose 6-dehydrogenase